MAGLFLGQMEDSSLGQMTMSQEVERMDKEPCYRLMNPGEEERVCALVADVFNEYVAPGFAAEGVRAFLDYVQPDALLARLLRDHFVLVAEIGAQIVGAIEVRGNQHVSLLFVHRSYQGRGIGRELVQRALQVCNSAGSGPPQVSVNSSLLAVSFYEKLGFRRTSAPQVQDGIRYVPMELGDRADVCGSHGGLAVHPA
jgi:GNAT superfamily N-acetyltransferase